MKLQNVFIFSALLFCGVYANATPVFTAGDIVTTTTRSLTFDSLTSNGISLNAYNEDSMFVTVADTTYQGFSAFSYGDTRTTGFHYGSGGNSSYVSIRGTDNARMYALDFLLGDGQNPPTTNVRWNTYRDGLLTGTGLESGFTRGTVAGWSDTAGFDELRVAASTSSVDPGFGSHQSIAIDDLRVQLVAVPAPLGVVIFGIGLIGLAFRRKHV